MKRRLLNLITALSLLLSLPATVMWVRSYFTEDAIQVSKQSMTGFWFEQETWQAWSGWGGLSVSWGHQGGDLVTQKEADAVRGRTRCDGQWHYHFVQWNWGLMYGDIPFGSGARRTVLGFAFDRNDYTGGPPAGFQKFWRLVMPWPAIAALLAAPAALRGGAALLRRRRLRRLKEGRCLRCGYDLRATPGRCPECGADAAPHPAPVTTADPDAVTPAP